MIGTLEADMHARHEAHGGQACGPWRWQQLSGDGGVQVSWRVATDGVLPSTLQGTE